MTEEKKKLETVTGTLTGWYGNDITVDGKKYPMCIKAASWVRDHNYTPGIQIVLEIDAKGIIQRAYPPKQQQAGTGPDPEKLKKHGFGQPTPGPAPAAEIKEVPPTRAPDELFTDEEVSAMKAKADAAKAAPVTGIEKICADTKARNAAYGGASSCTSPVPREAETAVITQVLPAYPAPKNYSADEMLLLRNVIAKGCTEPEFKLLMYMANTYGLDPLLKQIWAVKRNESQPALIFAGRDGMLAIAHRSGHFDGMHSEVVYEGTGKDKKPVSAWCEIWRNDMTHSFRVEVPFAEYNTGFSVWKTNPSAMILKVAESVCLRKAFSVSGLYSPEEINTEQGA